MSLFTLEPLPAAEGDCLLLHWGTPDDPKLAVIDGGPGRIYETSLRPRLEEIAANRGLDQLPVELLMVSHMDNDHIVGVKKLLRKIRNEIENNTPAGNRLLTVKRLWHNVFNDILGDSIDAYYEGMTATLTASAGGEPNPVVVKKLTEAFEQRQGDDPEEAGENAWDISLLLAGHGEGRDVREDHDFLFKLGEIAALNHPFHGDGGQSTLITAEKTPDAKKIEGLSFKIVGPLEAEIKALQKEFDKYIKDNHLTAEAVLAAYADKSAKNLSSIVTLVEFGGRTILLTGDARGDKVLSGLEATKLVEPGGKLKVDILKGNHHGSIHNVDRDFFERIVAKTYVFSGNGIHGNPDRETLELLTSVRGKEAKYRIVLTYPVDKIDEKHKAELARKNKPWVPSKHSLADFFATAEADGYKFTLETGLGIKIDLGEELPW